MRQSGCQSVGTHTDIDLENVMATLAADGSGTVTKSCSETWKWAAQGGGVGMANEIYELQLEHSGKWPRTDLEIRRADLPRRKLEEHPTVKRAKCR